MFAIDLNQGKSNDPFTITIDVAENVRYIMDSTEQYALVVRVLPNQNHITVSTEKDILVGVII